MKVCSLSTIDYLITDLPSTDEKLQPYEGHTKII